MDDLAEAIWEVVAKLCEIRDLHVTDRAYDLERVLYFEELLAREHLPQDDADAEHVGLGLFLCDLGGGEGHCTGLPFLPLRFLLPEELSGGPPSLRARLFGLGPLIL